MAATAEQTGWADRLVDGDRRALARALTAVENGTPLAREILRDIHPRVGRAKVIGITGPPGVGKSTLVNACVRALRERDQTVGIVAVDPSSVYSGGAILGDRIRMKEHAGDAGVFIRSLASRGHLGGLCRAAARVIDVLDAAGRDYVLVETVGTGQSEVEIARIAQVKIVVLQPDAGDGIQALKAGVLEIADILVVNKSDLPNAEHCTADLRQMLQLRVRKRRRVPILQTTATSGEGVAELVDAIEECARDREDAGTQRNRRLLVNETCQRLQQILEQPASASLANELDTLAEALLRAELEVDDAVDRLLAPLGEILKRYPEGVDQQGGDP